MSLAVGSVRANDLVGLFLSFYPVPMANMSYCRFQNTYADLRDCMDHFEDPIEPIDDSDFNEDLEYLSEEEASARAGIIELAEQIVRDFSMDYDLDPVNVDLDE